MKFYIELTTTGVLDVDEIWPDGDAPVEPTVADVQELIEEEGLRTVMRDWGFEDGLALFVGEA